LKREFREKCKEKEERNRKRPKEIIKNITSDAQIWKFVNLDRKKARIVEEIINKYRGLGEAFSRIIGRRERDR